MIQIFVYDDGSMEVTKEPITGSRHHRLGKNGPTKFSAYLFSPNYAIWLEGEPVIDQNLLEYQTELRDVKSEVCLVRPQNTKRILFHKGSSLNVSK